jgi:hypothetical protein
VAQFLENPDSHGVIVIVTGCLHTSVMGAAMAHALKAMGREWISAAHLARERVTRHPKVGPESLRTTLIVSAAALLVATACSSGGPAPTPNGGATSTSPTSGGATAASPTGGGAAPSTPSAPQVTSGILTVDTVNTTGKRTYGFIDPSSGNYSAVATFLSKPSDATVMNPTLAVSPDLTKLAVTSGIKGVSVAGWVDTSGNFTNATPDAAASPGGGNEFAVFSVGFDGKGNFYYRKQVDNSDSDVYEVAAGSTTNAQKIKSQVGRDAWGFPWIDYDGSMQFGCRPVPPVLNRNALVNWLGPNAIVRLYATEIAKEAVAGHDQKGCLQLGTETLLLPGDANPLPVQDAVSSPDGTKVAFTSPGTQAARMSGQAGLGLYLVPADGSRQTTQLNLPPQTSQQTGTMTLLAWK